MQVDSQRAPCVEAEDKQEFNVFSQHRKSNKPLKAFSIMATDSEMNANLYTSLCVFLQTPIFLFTPIYMLTTAGNATARKPRWVASHSGVVDVKIGLEALLSSLLYCTACETLPALTEDLLLNRRQKIECRPDNKPVLTPVLL